MHNKNYKKCEIWSLKINTKKSFIRPFYSFYLSVIYNVLYDMFLIKNLRINM